MDTKAYAQIVRAFKEYRSVDGTAGVTNSTAGIEFKDGLYVGGSLNTEGLPLSTDNITILGEAGDGFIAFGVQSARPSQALTHVYVDSAGKFWIGRSGSSAFNIGFDNQLLTADRIYIAPNKSGTFAMTDDNVSQFTNDAGYLQSAALANYVQGPASAVSGSLPTFNGTTGKLIQDSGILASTVVVGPASVPASGRVASFNGTTGKLIQDAGFLASDVVLGPASAVSGQLPMFNGTTGKLISDSGVAITGTGIISLGGFNFTVPATGTAVLTSRALTAGAGLTGGGDFGADRSFAVGAGAGITVNADDVALTTPGTLTISTGNVSAGNHTHAITSSANPGTAAALLASDTSGGLQLVSLNLSGNFNPSGFVAGHLIPTPTDTYDLGSSTKLWRKGWLSEMDAILFAKNTVSLVGGWLMLTKNEGTIPVGQDIGTGDTTIDFGQSMTLDDFVLFRAAGAVEYVKVISLSAGTRYNVTRNLDGSGANAWPAGSVYAVLGNTGNGRIELNANSTPRISMILQGSTYNAQTEILRVGDLNGNWGYSAETYGFAVGDFSAADSWLTVDPPNGLRIFGGEGNVTLDGAGLSFVAPEGSSLLNQIKWYDGSDKVGHLEVQSSASVEPMVELASILPASNTTGSSRVQIRTVATSGTQATIFELEQGGSATSGVGYANLYGFGGSFLGLVIGDPDGAPDAPTHMLDVYGTGWFQSDLSTDGKIIKSTVIGARVYNSSNISCADGAVVTMTFNNERFDTDSIHSTSSNTSRLTATTAGKYLIEGGVEFAANSTGNRMIRILLNGTTQIKKQLSFNTGVDPCALSLATIYDLAAGDYVELQAYQASGGSLNVSAVGNYSPEFAMTRIA